MSKGSLFSAFCLLSGIGLAALGLSGLRSENAPLHSRNLFAIQGSAYGRLLARLSETTVDRVWHLGVEQIVPHYMSGEMANTGRDPLTDSTAKASDSTAGTVPPPTVVTPPASTQNLSSVEIGKKWIQARVVAQYTRTNPNALNQSHLATVYKDIEELLLRSFKLDPTHYGTYDSYHLFLTTADFGGSMNATEQAQKLANVVFSSVFKENEDPEPWLTAAAAATNLYQLAAQPYLEKSEAVPLNILKEYENKIGYCLTRFDDVQAEAERIGNWDRLSTERQMEIAERSLFAKRTFKQFDAMIARAESRSQRAKPQGEVAKSGAEEKD